MPIDIHWTAYISALSAPAIAIFAALIGYRQWRTAHTKLSLDLFDRRAKVYQAATDLLNAAITQYPNDEQLAKFLSETAHASWLYDDNIADHLKSIYFQVVEVQTIIKGLPTTTMGRDGFSERSAYDMSPRIVRRRTILLNMLREIPSVFKPYLQIEPPSLMQRIYRAIPVVPSKNDMKS